MLSIIYIILLSYYLITIKADFLKIIKSGIGFYSLKFNLYLFQHTFTV